MPVGGCAIPLVLRYIPILRKFVTERRHTQHTLDTISKLNLYVFLNLGIDVICTLCFLVTLVKFRYIRPYASAALQLHAIVYCYIFQYTLFVTFPEVEKEHVACMARRFSVFRPSKNANGALAKSRPLTLKKSSEFSFQLADVPTEIVAKVTQSGVLDT